MAKNLLVTGATGKQGGALISALLASGSAADYTIYAVTRNSSSPAAKSLESKGIKLVQGNLDSPEGLFEGLPPIWGVFSVQLPMGQGQSPASEQRQGTQLIDAAIVHGHVRHFVYASVDRGGPKSSSDPTNIPHFISKFHIEEHLRAQAKARGITFTILRPVAFMDNLTNDFGGKGFTAAWRVALHGKSLQLISTTDIGWFGAQAIINSSSLQYANAEIALAGDSLTYQQAADIFQQRVGKPWPTTYDFIARLFLWAVKDIGLMFKWFQTDGYGADIQALRKQHPQLLTFGDWLDQKSAWRKSQ